MAKIFFTMYCTYSVFMQSREAVQSPPKKVAEGEIFSKLASFSVVFMLFGRLRRLPADPMGGAIAPIAPPLDPRLVAVYVADRCKML